jgi:hypothetical protein
MALIWRFRVVRAAGVRQHNARERYCFAEALNRGCGYGYGRVKRWTSLEVLNDKNSWIHSREVDLRFGSPPPIDVAGFQPQWHWRDSSTVGLPGYSRNVYSLRPDRDGFSGQAGLRYYHLPASTDRGLQL